MKQLDLFAVALGIDSRGPWRVRSVGFEYDPRELVIDIEFCPGVKFACPKCGTLCPVYDSRQKSWRHLNFFQYKCRLRACVPRVHCAQHGVLQVEVPWARPDSGFTLLFEAMVLLLCREMSVERAAEMVGEQDTRVWRLLHDLVGQALAGKDMSSVRNLLIDETSARRGHRYVTTIVDADAGDLLYIGQGKDGKCLGQFLDQFKKQGGQPEQIQQIGIDMSKSYIQAIAHYLPHARIVFDRFHIIALANQAIDELRKTLHTTASHSELKEARWALLTNEENQTASQLAKQRKLRTLYPIMGRALGLKEQLQDALNGQTPELLHSWYQWARRSQIPSFKRLAQTIRRHWQGVLAASQSKLNNGLIEAINGKIQLAKRIARGFKNFLYLRTISHLRCSHLHFPLPNPLPT